MAFTLADRVRETASSPGTGTVTLLGAVTGYQTFSAGIGANNTTYYVIADQSGSNWEVGLGTIGAGGTTLARTTVLSSSNSGSLVNFSSGTQDVFCDYTATKAVIKDSNGNVSVNCLFEGFTSQAASGTTITLTASSPQNLLITGSGGQTIKLPNATTLPNGAVFTFNNNQSSGAITVVNNSSTTIATINSGGYVSVVLLDNSTAAGSWDRHDSTPSNVSWSTNTLDYAGSITSATWNGNVVQVNRGGTGASTLTGYVKGSGTTALTASSTIPSTDISGLGTMSTQNASSVAITGGTIDNTVIGGTTPAAGTFTTITGQTEVLKGTGTNFLLYSNTFTNGVWAQSVATITANTTTDPFGGSTASTLLESTGTSRHILYYGITLPAQVCTASVYLKAQNDTVAQLQLSTNGGGTWYAALVNLSNGTIVANTSGSSPTNTGSSITSVGNGWYRVSVTLAITGFSYFVVATSNSTTPTYESNGNPTYAGNSSNGVYVYGAQVDLGTSPSVYTATTSAAVYGTPTLSFSGVAGLGLQSDGSLYVSPAGTGAIQAQATTSSTVGGNARGANAVDWQTSRGSASQVASSGYSFVGGGQNNTASNSYTFVGGGYGNTASGNNATVVAGSTNAASGQYSGAVSGYLNTAGGFYNFVGGGQSNSGTSGSAVTTQSGTMNGTTAVTLSGSNANIKVGQLILGTSISFNTYVAAISGTSLTLSQNASGSSTSTLSFYTPHGVVVGGGNNQATGSYSFIGGGGDAGTAANRNVASGDWSTVAGGFKNSATNLYDTVAGGFTNAASGSYCFIGGGQNQTVTGSNGSVLGGRAHTANGGYASIVGGYGAYSKGICGVAQSGATYFSTVGDAQSVTYVLSIQTTDATATALTTNQGAAGSTTIIALPNNQAYAFTGVVIARNTSNGDTSSWEVKGAIKRGSGVGTTALVGIPTITNIGVDTGASLWSLALSADTTNGGLAIKGTGAASTTIRWVAQITTAEVG